MSGWIKLQRQIEQNWIWHQPHTLRLCSHLLLGAATEAEAIYLLRSDIEAIWRELARRWPTVATLDEVRRDVCVDMAFNLGVNGFLKFRKTIGYIDDGKYRTASAEMLRSAWADQVGNRAVRLSEMMATGRRA